MLGRGGRLSPAQPHHHCAKCKNLTGQEVWEARALRSDPSDKDFRPRGSGETKTVLVLVLVLVLELRYRYIGIGVGIRIDY